MAKRMNRTERHEAHRRKVDAYKKHLRRLLRTGGHIYVEEHYRKAIREGEHDRAEAYEEMWNEIAAHNRNNPPDFPRQRVHDHLDDMRDLERRRREARDDERAAGIAEGARRKAAGIGGGLYATAEPEPEPEEVYDEPDPGAEEHEDRRRALRGHGLLSRTPALPQESRKKKRRKGYHGPPFVG